MNLKKITKKLAQVRDNTREKGTISPEDEKILRSLIGDTISIAQSDLQKLPKRVQNRHMPVPENDNTPLTAEQKFRLRLMEKTGTGSHSVH